MDEDITIKLKEILNSSKWTQEQLAYNLDVSFSTLNAWINGKAKPRPKALKAIDSVYLNMVGRLSVDPGVLTATKNQALSKKISVKDILSSENLLEKITLYLTYHTNTIEGSTMTLADVKEVLDDEDKVLTNKTAKEQMEARNHRTALFYLLDELNSKGKGFNWTEELILNTHLRLMNSLISSAGNYRSHGVRIMGSSASLAEHSKVPYLMNELVFDLNDHSDDYIGNIARLHARFERIHPFSDGNGRTGRLIMFIQALQYGIVPPVITKERKQAYYRYLEVADLDNNYSLITLFVAESILAADRLIETGRM
jgi:Fic family protein/DNA-binding XRE family transcriptional regulator